jgi:hypothetical protein
MDVFLIMLALFLPTMLLIKVVLKLLTKRNHGIKSPTLWVLSICLTPVTYILSILIWVVAISYYPDRDFDSKAWKKDEWHRYEYADDLRDSKILIGKDTTFVYRLLGDGYNQLDSTGNGNWVYDLGNSPGLFNIDPDFMKVEFIDGKVIRVSISRG